MKTLIEEGRLLKIDGGEYSDYYVLGFFKVIKSFDYIQESNLFKNSQKDKHYFQRDKFLHYLISKGYLFEIRHDTLYLSSYGEYDGVKYWQHS